MTLLGTREIQLIVVIQVPPGYTEEHINTMCGEISHGGVTVAVGLAALVKDVQVVIVPVDMGSPGPRLV